MPIRLLFFALCLPLAAQEPSQTHLDISTLARADREITSAVSSGRIPGAVLLIEREGQIYENAFGKKATYPRSEPNAKDTLYDAASLTKVVATTPCILQLVENGKISPEDKVQKYLPEFTGDPNKATVTLRHLLTHTSGLLAGIRRGYEWEGYENGIALACGEPSSARAGSAYVYSDINFILLGEIVRRVSGQPLNEYAAEHVFAPLGMADTGFLPPKEKFHRIAPTTRMPDRSVLRGTVHDPTARAMGGVAGHAGLFTTASDLARYCRMLLNGGEIDGTSILSADSVKLMTTVQSPEWITARRAFGLDIDSPYASLRGERFPLGSFGHTGWTGTSLWIDPFSRTFVILLANRNHPTETGSVSTLRKRISTIAAESVTGFDFADVPGALAPLTEAFLKEAKAKRSRPVIPSVRNGIDVLAAADFAPLKGLKVGLITNHTGIDGTNTSTIDLLHQSKEVTPRRPVQPRTRHPRHRRHRRSYATAPTRKPASKSTASTRRPARKPTAAQLAGPRRPRLRYPGHRLPLLHLHLHHGPLHGGRPGGRDQIRRPRQRQPHRRYRGRRPHPRRRHLLHRIPPDPRPPRHDRRGTRQDVQSRALPETRTHRRPRRRLAARPVLRRDRTPVAQPVAEHAQPRPPPSSTRVWVC